MCGRARSRRGTCVTRECPCSCRASLLHLNPSLNINPPKPPNPLTEPQRRQALLQHGAADGRLRDAEERGDFFHGEEFGGAHGFTSARNRTIILRASPTRSAVFPWFPELQLAPVPYIETVAKSGSTFGAFHAQ